MHVDGAELVEVLPAAARLRAADSIFVIVAPGLIGQRALLVADEESASSVARAAIESSVGRNDTAWALNTPEVPCFRSSGPAGSTVLRIPNATECTVHMFTPTHGVWIQWGETNLIQYEVTELTFEKIGYVIGDHGPVGIFTIEGLTDLSEAETEPHEVTYEEALAISTTDGARDVSTTKSLSTWLGGYNVTYDAFLVFRGDTPISVCISEGEFCISEGEYAEFPPRDAIRCHKPAVLFDGDTIDLSGLAWVDLQGLDFSGRDLTGASFLESDIRGANFSQCKLDGAAFSFVRADGAVFDGASLIKSDWSFAYAVGASFRQCMMAGADLSYAELGKTTFAGADLTGAVLRHTDIGEADWAEVNLSRANICEGTFIEDTNMKNAVVVGATIRDSNLSGSDTTGVDFSVTTLINVTMPDGSLHA